MGGIDVALPVKVGASVKDADGTSSCSIGVNREVEIRDVTSELQLLSRPLMR